MGNPVSNVGDLPQLNGLAGSFGNFDIHTNNVTHLVFPGNSSAIIRATSTADVIYLNAMFLSITTWEGVGNLFFSL